MTNTAIKPAFNGATIELAPPNLDKVFNSMMMLVFSGFLWRECSSSLTVLLWMSMRRNQGHILLALCFCLAFDRARLSIR